MAFRWRARDGPLIVVFGSCHQLKKTLSKLDWFSPLHWQFEQLGTSLCQSWNFLDPRMRLIVGAQFLTVAFCWRTQEKTAFLAPCLNQISLYFMNYTYVHVSLSKYTSATCYAYQRSGLCVRWGSLRDGAWVSFISKLLAFFFLLFFHLQNVLEIICFPLKCLVFSFLNSLSLPSVYVTWIKPYRHRSDDASECGVLSGSSLLVYRIFFICLKGN